MPSSVARFVGLVALLVAPSTGCWYGAYNNNRALHYVDGELVQTEPPTPAAYEAYLRARLALEREPADLEAARGHILEALRWHSSDPQLWTVKAEIEWRAGKLDAAEQALARALALRPGYPEAQRLLARLRDGESMATAASLPPARFARSTGT